MLWDAALTITTIGATRFPTVVLVVNRFIIDSVTLSSVNALRACTNYNPWPLRF